MRQRTHREIVKMEIEVATGTLESGTKFRVLVSEPVSADELRGIGNLLHGVATKAEALPIDTSGDG